jgi:hypothetical protein
MIRRLLPPRKSTRPARRGVPWSIVLPFAGGVAVIVALLVIALASGTSGALADILLTLLILCPLVVCALPIYALMIVLIFLMGGANRNLDRGLRRVGQVATAVEDHALEATQRAAGLTIRFNSAFTRLEKVAHRILNPHHPGSRLRKQRTTLISADGGSVVPVTHVTRSRHERHTT